MTKNTRYGPKKYGPGNATRYKGVKISLTSKSGTPVSTADENKNSQESSANLVSLKIRDQLLKKISNLDNGSREVLLEASVETLNQILVRPIENVEPPSQIKINTLENYPWNDLGPESDLDEIRFLGQCDMNLSQDRVFVKPLAILRDGKWYSISERISPSIFHHTGKVQSFEPKQSNKYNRWPKQPQEKEYGIWGIEFKDKISDNQNFTSTLLSGKKREPYVVHKVNAPSSNVAALREIVFDYATNQFPEDDRQLYLTSDNILFGLNNGRKVKTLHDASATFFVFRTDEILEAGGVLFIVEQPEAIGQLDLISGYEKFKQVFRSINNLLERKLTKIQLQNLIDSLSVIESNDISNDKTNLLNNLEKILENFDTVDEIINAFSRLPRFEQDYNSLLNDKIINESSELKQICDEKEELERQRNNLEKEVNSKKT